MFELLRHVVITIIIIQYSPHRHHIHDNDPDHHHYHHRQPCKAGLQSLKAPPLEVAGFGSQAEVGRCPGKDRMTR